MWSKKCRGLFFLLALLYQNKFASSFGFRAALRRRRNRLRKPFIGPLVPTMDNQHSSPSEIDATLVALPVEMENGARAARVAHSPTEDSPTELISFVGTKTVTTPPAPCDLSALNDFFAVEDHRSLLFLRNEAIRLPGPPSTEQERIWYQEAMLGGASPDDYQDLHGDNNQLIQIKAYLSLAGLKVISANTIGAKLLEKDGQYPEYHFTVLGSELTPEGPAPLVWLFNQLIKYRDTTSSFTRVGVAPASSANEIVFVTDARLETRLRIPSIALKFLPAVNLEKFEQQGSEAVRKLLEKELEPALLGFRSAYVQFVSEHAKGCQPVE